MPVIRGQAQVSLITAEQRQKVAEQLAEELRGGQIPSGPVIFEIPLEQQDRFDVLVVWDAWGPFTSTDRSNMILEAYKKRPGIKVAQALGVTYKEAIEQQLLPYAVTPMIRRNEVSQEDVESIKRAMLAEGGFAFPNSNVDLRFPTMALAEQAHKRLTDAFPAGYWSIVQTLEYIQ